MLLRRFRVCVRMIHTYTKRPTFSILMTHVIRKRRRYPFEKRQPKRRQKEKQLNGQRERKIIKKNATPTLLDRVKKTRSPSGETPGKLQCTYRCHGRVGEIKQHPIRTNSIAASAAVNCVRRREGEKRKYPVSRHHPPASTRIGTLSSGHLRNLVLSATSRESFVSFVLPAILKTFFLLRSLAFSRRDRERNSNIPIIHVLDFYIFRNHMIFIYNRFIFNSSIIISSQG